MSGRPEIADTDVAVIGMAGRFPGARNVAEFWENVRGGVESIRRLGDDELRAAGVPEERLRHPRYVKVGAVLDGFDRFDAPFFEIGVKDAAIMDPQHRLFLECAWEALEHAAHPPSRFPGSIGVFAGCGTNLYLTENLLTNPDLVRDVGFFLLRHTGNDKDFLSTFVSYKLNLTGPSLSIQTACSTSLVAIHVACQSLLAGECDLALAGGSTVNLPHLAGYFYQEGEILSPDGHCRAFEARSQGTVFGSGAGVVVLRPLRAALEDGDFVHAVIKGSAVNNDGAMKAGYLAPSVDGQAHAIAEALSVAGVPAESVSCVEAHGTGTPIGDPIEVEALTQAFRQSTEARGFCALGSVKPNIGHLDTAAGVASFIKTVEALRHGEIPPLLHYKEPNPAIDLEASPFYVATRPVPWPGDAGPRRAGVSSLGVGGTNAHVILEEAPPPPPADPAAPWQLVTLSARSAEALDAATDALAGHLEAAPGGALADAAYTLALGRRAFETRRIVVARHAAEAAERLAAREPRRVFTGVRRDPAPSVGFLFPGGGAQYPRMALGLYEADARFREEMDRGLEAARRHVDRDLRRLLFCAPGEVEGAERELERPSLQLPATFLVEHALARLWMSWGIRPAMMLGHSVGENVAACVAGVLSLEDALGLVALRGRLFERVPEGGMTSVALSPEALEPLLGEHLVVAALNAPELTVVSGPTEELARLEGRLDERSVEHRRVRIQIAAHSPMLEPILGEFRAYLERIALHPPEVPFISNRTGRAITREEATDPAYWVAHLRNPVRFAEGVGALLESPGRVLLEVGPGRTLGSLARQHPELGPGRTVLASLRHPEEEADDLEFLLTSLGRLWVAGVEPDWSALYRGQRRRRVPLPTYPFERKRYWIEPGRRGEEAREAPERLEMLPNPDDWLRQPVWRAQEAPRGAWGAQESRRWLVFVDPAGLGAELVSRLEAAGQEVVVVREGDAFYRFGEREYALAPEAGREGYEALVGDLAERDALPDRILHLWSVTADESARPGSSFFHRSQERGFWSLLFLAQALGDRGLPDALDWIVVSNGMQAVGDEVLAWPEKATLLGPVKVVPRELRGVTCRSVDVEVPPPAQGRRARSARQRALSELAGKLLGELAAPGANRVVAYRGGQRLEQGFERVRPEALGSGGASIHPIREGGVYLVTGGLGGIGLRVAEHLARRRARLVLVSRAGLPDREAWPDWLATHGERDATSRRIAKVRELEALGAEVLAPAADVANIEQMRGVLADARERFGPIQGVIHAAGVLEDAVVQMKTPESVERVFTPKVHGTQVLAELFEGAKLDFLVLFSSTSAVLGPAGQVDYTGANAFLNAFARSGRAAGIGRVLALEWGVWNEVGMARALRARLAGGEETERGERRALAQPLLDECLVDGSDRQSFTSTLAVDRSWLLDEHRTREGQAFLPGTAYLEMAREALAEAEPGKPIELREVTFLNPLGVGEDEVRELRIELVPERPGRYRFEVTSRGEGEGDRVLHVQGHGVLGRLPAAAPLDLTALERRCSREVEEGGDAALATAQERHLAFGPRWRSLRRVAYGEGESLARLELPAVFAGELAGLALHPALLDVATGYALHLVPGYAPERELLVPLHYGRVRIHGPLPARAVSHVRLAPGESEDVACFDVAIADESGEVRIEVEGLALRRLAAATALAGQLGAKPSIESGATGGELGRRSAVERLFLESFEAGIRAEAGLAVIERVLASDLGPEVLASSIALEPLVARHEAVGLEGIEVPSVRFARPALETPYEAPRTEIEQTLVGFFEELLGVDPVGIHDDFFALGGHSLIAVRLFARIKKAYDVEFPLSVLFDAPSVAGCAELLREELGEETETGGGPVARRPRHRFLVPMNPVGETPKKPFFLVSGMFGNVLNLRHLAAHLGEDQPVYAIQAKGLYGDDEPHRRFEDMARDYLAEVREVQPEGPYLLGGFSGGGITAYEMAQQLRAAGEAVGILVMLDTPAPRVPALGGADRLRIQWQRLRRQGPSYVWDWARNRWRWELGRLRDRFAPQERDLTPAEFRSEQIEAGFREALARYGTRPYPGRVVLFRPPLDRSHPLGGGRVASARRELVDERNFWAPYLEAGIEVHEVTGNHDSMVLEPYVRVLGQKLRASLESAQRAAAPGEEAGC